MINPDYTNDINEIEILNKLCDDDDDDDFWKDFMDEMTQSNIHMYNRE